MDQKRQLGGSLQSYSSCGCTADCKLLRSLVFIGLAVSGLAPVAHIAINEGMTGLDNFPLRDWGVMALFYLAGAIIYVARIPEKFFPGTFDLWVSDKCENFPNFE